MKLSRITKAVAALAGAAALTLGVVLPAHAVTQVSSGHADVVAINSGNSVGSKIGSTFNYWSGGTPLFDHEFVYNKPIGKTGVSCTGSGGVLWIPDGVSGLPSVGLDNASANSYQISVSKVSGSSGTGGVTLDTPLSGSVSTGGASETIGSGGHEHGNWVFTLGSCGLNQTHTFTLKFTAKNTSTNVSTNKNIKFIINT
ncbi:MAG: hypothetical protein ACK5LO_13485 [Leucobacter sp.]